MAIFDDKFDLNLFALCFFTITLIFGFILTIFVCCGKKKPWEDEQTSQKTKKTNEKEPNDVKNHEYLELTVEKKPKSKEPKTFAKVYDYATLMGPQEMNPTFVKKNVVNDAQQRPTSVPNQPQETMGFNMITDSKRREIENKATQKQTPKVEERPKVEETPNYIEVPKIVDQSKIPIQKETTKVDEPPNYFEMPPKVVDQSKKPTQTIPLDRTTKQSKTPIPLGKDTKNAETVLDAEPSKPTTLPPAKSPTMIPMHPPTSPAAPATPVPASSKPQLSKSQSKDENRKVPTTLPPVKFLPKQVPLQPFDRKQDVKTRARSQFVFDKKDADQLYRNRDKLTKVKDIRPLPSQEKGMKVKDNRPIPSKSKQIRDEPKESVFAWEKPK